MVNVNLYQSYYLKDQEKSLDSACLWYDNTKNPNPDLREYPQMKGVHKMNKDNPDTAYGLVSWKFEQKALIKPTKFIQFVKENPENDFWFINPCPIIESLFINPWHHGELWHPGITSIAENTFHAMGKDTRVLGKVYPNTHMFFANYFVARAPIWEKLFDYCDRFYYTIDNDAGLKKRMMAASGYSGDPGMSHFIFLFERLVPTFLMENLDIRVSNYEYTHEEVQTKFPVYAEFSRMGMLSAIKSDWARHQDGPDNDRFAISWILRRDEFVNQFPNAFGKE